MRLVLLGGGGFRTPLIFRALLQRRDEVDVDELVLFDLSPDRLTVIAAVLDGMAVGVRRPPRVRLTTDLDDALTGADVVFAAIRVGGTQGRVRDERRALELGVLGQETVGAGGLTYGLRTLPVMLEIAERIGALAPYAWVLNFTNPAGMITEALRELLGDRVIGICDSPIGLVRRACRALDVPESAATVDYVGINHLGWLRSLQLDGTDLLPSLLADEAGLAGIEEGRLFGAELLQGLRAIPNEYLYFYYAQRDLVAELATGRTRGEVVADSQRAFYRAFTDAGPVEPAAALAAWSETRMSRERSYLAEARGADERDQQDLSGGGYEHVALDLMAALAGGPARTLIVNSRNGSAVPQLPPELVLEVPATVTSDGVGPLPVARPLDLHQLGLIASVRAAERTLIDAVRHRSSATARLAFEQHPLIGSPRIAAALVDSTVADHPQLGSILR
ncbi:family 4 glycosyl hydrolase [Nakamurella lactea]|uniref:family 4 glycosyl hydrolase n=1 Tax=Nakamurella lactea TaxID=459515 RepID=UPI00048B58F5|nr:6-phospho-beta-glucosidase [Nakamurella lactea]